MRLIVDASVAVQLALSETGFPLLSAGHELASPPLLWSESCSAIHELGWRGQVSAKLFAVALARVLEMPVERMDPDGLHAEAWRIADEAGWAKTYDAEYVAAARLSGRPLLTLDGRLRRGAARFVDVRTPAEL